MLQNVSGTQMDYETFKAQFDTIPQLKNIVTQFDGRGLTLKTKEKPVIPANELMNNLIDILGTEQFSIRETNYESHKNELHCF